MPSPYWLSCAIGSIHDRESGIRRQSINHFCGAIREGSRVKPVLLAFTFLNGTICIPDTDHRVHVVGSLRELHPYAPVAPFRFGKHGSHSTLRTCDLKILLEALTANHRMRPLAL